MSGAVRRAGAPAQLNGIQLLRFVAVFLVLASHIVLEIWRRYADDGRYHFWHEFGPMGVDIFFVISGFVITISTLKLEPGGAAAAWLFCKRRLIRIVPMYWFYTGLKAALIVGVGSRAFPAGLDPRFLLESLLFFPVVNPAGQRLPVLESGWTLSFEMLFYAAFALALWRRLPPLRFSLVLLGGLLFVSQFLRDYLWFDFFGRSLLLEFLLGGLIARLWVRGLTLPPALPPLLLLVSLVWLFWPAKPDGLDRLLTVGLPSALLVMSMVWLERHALVARVCARFKLLGDASYSVYLSHGLLVPAMFMVLQKAGVQNTAVVFALTLAGALALGCVLYLALEQPLTARLNRRWGAAGPATPAAAAARPPETMQKE
ncbi:peptidoglycan/LPS O-acetylase OafA/YrhL [Duganella sp. 1224]|uniref:acyltransferase family protein n=1 Tax=Duganella sp. 1224 TaxID=2587052 RepID=UPI0015C907B4|nr:acyltransferase [Duganella sp. 1224]NYE62153.1 peptidoglycan/LPS O-acetylase OafA/YrhL [Duganella sp. 1224]